MEITVQIDNDTTFDEHTSTNDLPAKIRAYVLKSEDMTPLAGATQACRKALGISKKKFGDLIRINDLSVSKLENGKTTRPAFKTLENLQTIAEILELGFAQAIFEGYMLKENRKTVKV